jgi:hypothetical protein
LHIAGIRHYLLTTIDYFSRYHVAWGIVKSVTHRVTYPLALHPLLPLGEGEEGSSVEGRGAREAGRQ